MAQTPMSASPPEGGAGDPAPGAPPRSEQFAQYARENSDPSRQAELFLQAAHLSEEAEKNPERAAQFYREALAADPHQQTALVALERIYLRNSDWRSLYQILGLHADVMDSLERGQARAEIFRKMARLAAERLGETELACVCYENLLDNCPGEPEAIRYLMGRYEQTQDWASLEALLSSQAEQVADPVERAELLRILADGLRYAAGRAEEAIEAYRGALEADPSNRGAFRGLAGTLDAAGRREDIRDLFARRERALSEEPAGPDRDEELFAARMELAALLAAGPPENRKMAQQLLEAAASLKPQDPRILDREAELWMEAGDFIRAARAFENLLAAPNLPAARRSDALLALAQLSAARLGETDRARRYLQEIFQLHRREPLSANLYAAQHLMAEICFDQRSMEQARTLFSALLEKTASEERQSVCEYHLRLAQVEEALGARDDALGHLEAVLAVSSRFGRALRDRARILFDLRRWDQALPAQLAHLAALPSGAGGTELDEALLRLARIYEELGDYDKSLRRYEEVLARNPDYLEAREGLGRAFRHQGRASDALAVFEALVELYAATPDRRAYGRAAEQLAGLYEEQGERGKAKEFYEAALLRDDTLLVSHERLAILCEQELRWGAARDHFTRLLSLLPPHTPGGLRDQIARSLERAERNAFLEEHG